MAKGYDESKNNHKNTIQSLNSSSDDLSNVNTLVDEEARQPGQM